MSTFRATRVAAMPGQTVLRLDADWNYDNGLTLPAGTEVIPIFAGMNSRTNRRECVVQVIGAWPNSGRTCIGPL